MGENNVKNVKRILMITTILMNKDKKTNKEGETKKNSKDLIEKITLNQIQNGVIIQPQVINMVGDINPNTKKIIRTHGVTTHHLIILNQRIIKVIKTDTENGKDKSQNIMKTRKTRVRKTTKS